MRYPTDGLWNRLPGYRALCHSAIAITYSAAKILSTSKAALAFLASKNRSFLSLAMADNLTISMPSDYYSFKWSAIEGVW